MLFRRQRRPAPCPGCDSELDGAVADGDPPVCPHCELELVPVKVAGFWRRVGATGIDLAILSVTAGPLHLGLRLLAPGVELAPGSTGLDALFQTASAELGAILSRGAPLLVMASLYFVLFLALTGRTPGQRVLGMRVIDRQGGLPGPLKAGIRVAANAIGLLPGALGALWIALDEEKRGFHDVVAGTYVIREP